MELKFTATVRLNEADIRNLITAEVMRRHKDVKVLNVVYDISQYNAYGIGIAGVVNGNGGFVAATPMHSLNAAMVTVEATASPREPTIFKGSIPVSGPGSRTV